MGSRVKANNGNPTNASIPLLGTGERERRGNSEPFQRLFLQLDRFLRSPCSVSCPTPTTPPRPLFVAGRGPSFFLLLHPLSPSVILFAFRCAAPSELSRVLIGRFALGKLWRQFPWSTPTHSGAAEVARGPRNARDRLRGRTTSFDANLHAIYRMTYYHKT